MSSTNQTPQFIGVHSNLWVGNTLPGKSSQTLSASSMLVLPPILLIDISSSGTKACSVSTTTKKYQHVSSFWYSGWVLFRTYWTDPTLDDRLKKKILKPWKDGLCTVVTLVCVCMCVIELLNILFDRLT